MNMALLYFMIKLSDLQFQQPSLSENKITLKSLKKNFTPIHSWIDNYDLAVFTSNGYRETHALAIERMQPTDVKNPDEDHPFIIFSWLSKVEMKRVKCSELSAVTFELHPGSKQTHSTCS